MQKNPVFLPTLLLPASSLKIQFQFGVKCLAVRKGRIGGLQTFGTAFSLAGAFHTHVRLFCGLDMHSKHTGWLTDCAQTVGNVFLWNNVGNTSTSV